MTPPLAYRFPIGLAFWIAFFWAFAREFALNRRTGPKVLSGAQDRGSYRVVVVGQGIAFFLAFALPSVDRFAIHSYREPLYFAGIALLVCGGLLRRHCFRMLGEQFTATVRVRPEDVIIERGAYRWVRHPSYSAALLMFAGVGLGLGSWLSLAILLGTALIVYGYRIRVEEAALTDKHGDLYRAYASRTRRLVPHIF